MEKREIKKEVFLIAILSCFACLIRIYKLSTLMPFYGDVGRDFLVAKNILTEHQFPLFGPPTSLGWLRLGPLVYYLWALAFLIWGFQPVSIAYLVILFDLGTMVLIYLFGFRFLDRRKGFIAALLYAFSPLAIFHSRIALHTSLSPFFVMLTVLFFSYWLDTKKERFLYLSFFAAGLMLQTHLAMGIIVFCLLFHLLLKEKGAGKIFRSFLFLLIPLIPLLFADFAQKRFMMAKFIAWIPYRVLSFFGILTAKNVFTFKRGLKTIQVFASSIQKTIFLPNQFLSCFLLFISLLYSYRLVKKNKIMKFLLTTILFSAVTFFIHGEPQEHYLIFLVPFFALFLSNFLVDLLKGRFLALAFFLLVFILSINIVSLVRFNYYVTVGVNPLKFSYGIPLGQQIGIMKFIIKDSGDESYQIINPPDMMALTALYENYRYLGWWLGKEEKEDGILKYRIYGRKHAILSLKEGEEMIEFPSTFVVKRIE